MASLYNKKGILYLQLCKNGIRKQVSLRVPDTEQNRKKVTPRFIKEIESSLFESSSSVVRTVSFYADLYLRSRSVDCKFGTMQKYKIVVDKYVLPKFGDLDISIIKPSDIKFFIQKLDLSSSSILNISSVFSGIFDEAVYDEAIRDNPFKYVRLPKKVCAEARPFTVDEVNLLLEKSDGFLKNLLALLFYTGLRSGEAMALRWESVDWQNGFISVVSSRRQGREDTPKTSSGFRRIPIFGSLLPYLQNQFLISGQFYGYVFCHSDGTPFWDYKNIRDFAWKSLLKKCGIQYRRLYDTRSTFATVALSSGKFTVNEVAYIMGHSGSEVLFRKYNKYIKSEVSKISKDFSFTTLSTTPKNVVSLNPYSVDI